jgi:hypothetical protein
LIILRLLAAWAARLALLNLGLVLRLVGLLEMRLDDIFSEVLPTGRHPVVMPMMATMSWPTLAGSI